MREKDRIILWPIYFDSTRTRSEGRRVPKKLAVRSPRLSDIQAAAQKLGLQFEVVPDAAYPRSPWRRMGYISVPKNRPKNRLLKEIAENLSKGRP
ncbi:MAG: signal recognition particle subunit SRP19/SEC65 family protein [Candidatus Bathyarchaeia archaeon]